MWINDYTEFEIDDNCRVSITSTDNPRNHICIELYNKNDIQYGCRIALMPIEDYSSGDFFQESFSSNPAKRQGFGTLLHDFLIQRKDALNSFGVVEIYSSNIYSKAISESALSFWEKRAKLNKAEFIPEKNRYRIKW